MNLRYPVTLLILLLATGCAHQSGKQELPSHLMETFATHITEDGTKFFDYELSVRSVPRHSRSREIDLDRRMEVLVEQSGYCRDGFLELYRNPAPRRITIRGECREAASEEDIKNFR